VKATSDQGAGLDDGGDSGTTGCFVMITPNAIAIVTGRLWSGNLLRLSLPKLMLWFVLATNSVWQPFDGLLEPSASFKRRQSCFRTEIRSMVSTTGMTTIIWRSLCLWHHDDKNRMVLRSFCLRHQVFFVVYHELISANPTRIE